MTFRKSFSFKGLLSRGDWIRTSDLLVPNQQAPRSKRLTAQRVTETAAPACPNACPNEGENGNAAGSPDAAFSPTERRQEGKSEGEGGTLVDLLTLDAGAGLDLDRLADELRARLTPEQRRRLAELLTVGQGDNR